MNNEQLTAEMVALTPDQMNIIRHSLGLNDDGTERHRGAGMYRNRYCTSVNDPNLEALVTLGLMQRGHVINDGRDMYYFVTDAGKVEAIRGVREKKLTRSQQRYQDYLDSDCGLNFIEWLRSR